MAYEIFDLSYATVVKSGLPLAWTNIKNGSNQERPRPGALLIWKEGGEFEMTGHVAVVTEVSDYWIRVIEQNVEDIAWGDTNGRNYSRELQADIDKDTGSYTIHETWGKLGGNIIGWKMLPQNFVADPIPHPTDF